MGVDGLVKEVPMGVILDFGLLLPEEEEEKLPTSLTGTDIKTMFRFFDSDKSGKVSFSELDKMLRQMDLLEPDGSTTSSMRTSIDIDEDGEISLLELIDAIESKKLEIKTNMARRIRRKHSSKVANMIGVKTQRANAMAV